MDESDKDNNGSFIDPWFTYSPWERECLQHFETDPDAEARLLLEKQAILDSLWASFQNAAKSVAQLYKGRKELAVVQSYNSLTFLCSLLEIKQFTLDSHHFT